MDIDREGGAWEWFAHKYDINISFISIIILLIIERWLMINIGHTQYKWATKFKIILFYHIRMAHNIENCQEIV